MEEITLIAKRKPRTLAISGMIPECLVRFNQKAIGGQFSPLESPRIEFKPTTNEVKLDKVTEFQGVR